MTTNQVYRAILAEQVHRAQRRILWACLLGLAFGAIVAELTAIYWR